MSFFFSANVKSALHQTLMAFQLLLLVTAVVLLCFSLWLQFDPARSFLLQLVHFSESAPYLKFAVYLMLATAMLMFFAVGVGFSGVFKLERCLLSGFISLLVLLINFKFLILVFLLLYHLKFADESAMTQYLNDTAYNRYSRDKWVAPLMDSIQFYHKCCGGYGARDYEGSFWYQTNELGGTRAFVPISCCRQKQDARAWDLKSIDPECIRYNYTNPAFNEAVNWKGCGSPTYAHLNWLLRLLAIFLILLTLLDAVGLFLAVRCLCQVWSITKSIIEV